MDNINNLILWDTLSTQILTVLQLQIIIHQTVYHLNDFHQS